MKVNTSIKLNVDILNHLKDAQINISSYINELIIKDLTKKNLNDTTLKKLLDKARAEEKKTQIIQELKIIGAINNIMDRVEAISKGDERIGHLLLKKNIELLENEFTIEYSKETQDLIKSKYIELQELNIKMFEPYLKKKKLTNGKEKTKKIKGL